MNTHTITSGITGHINPLTHVGPTGTALPVMSHPDYRQMTDAIIKTTNGVGTVGKGAFNQHGGYGYVSIDRFYETVAKIAAEHGLTWVVREVSAEILPSMGKSGAIRFTYEVDLRHSSGAVERGYSRLTILHPVQGAQTAGSALSYADKCFMRQCFKTATGEKDIDADATDNKALDTPKQEVKKAPPPDTPVTPTHTEQPAQNDNALPGEEDTEGWRLLEDCLRLAIESARTQDELKQAWSDNLPGLEHAKAHDETMHKRIVAQFTSKKKELKKNG